MSNTKRLETARLILREYRIEDVEQVFINWASDPLCCQFLSFEPHKDLTETKKNVQNWIDNYDNGSFDWVIETKDNHEIVGSISVTNGHCALDLQNGIAEIGYCFGSKFWGRGYATEALRAIIEYLLTEAGMYLVEARHISGNPASGRVMQKAGMKQEAVLRSRRINKVTKERNDLIIYSITKDEL